MAENSKIEWCDHTFNPWWGCTRVSAGCAHCYAEDMARRWNRARWGKGQPRVLVSDGQWRQPMKWNAAAEQEGVRRRVFCASMADVFDDEVDETWHFRLWLLVCACPSLDWLLLTKRPENFDDMLPWRQELDQARLARQHPSAQAVQQQWHSIWRHVWLGVSVENQKLAEERLPILTSTPAAVRFASVEPLLSGVDLRPWLVGPNRLDWVIVGGESVGARPCSEAWVRQVVEQCREFHVPCFVKQMGRHWSRFRLASEHYRADRDGRDPSRWPEDLRVRRFPTVSSLQPVEARP